MMLQQLLLLDLLLMLSQYSGTQTDATAQTNSSGVYLMYKGEIFPNNSIILYDYGSNVSIHCVTDLRPCCATPEQGEWYEPGYPSERNVSSERVSRSNNGTISMLPISYNFGLHHCVLPNATNTIQHIYFGIYELHDPYLNIYVPQLQEMVYNTSSHTLTCISSDSLVTNVIWRRNGVTINDDGLIQILSLTDTYRVQYHSQLIGDFDIAGITCQVSNTIGSSQSYPIIESGVTLSISAAESDEEVIHKFSNNTSLQSYFGQSVNISGRITYQTSYSDCCANNHSHTGECFFPNGTRISSNSLEIYISRSEQKIQLHFQNATNVTGIYQCIVPDQHGKNQRFHFTLQAESSIQNDNTVRIDYNPVSSTFQCEFKGHAYDVEWYFYSSAFNFRDFEISLTGLLAVGNQYHQSKIHSANEESYYINELTITDRNASFGPYSCAVVTYSFSLEGPVRSWSTSLFTDLGFSYRNKPYGNNSIIVVHPKDFEIHNYYYYYYRLSLPVVMCVSDNSSCCSRNSGYLDWFYPSGRQVPDIDIGYFYNYYFQDHECPFQFYDYYEHYTPMLNLVVGALFTETINRCSGLYRCLIPDRHGELQQLFLGIYNDNTESSPTISSFYISQAPEYSLLCISNNSAATVVTWRRNGYIITIDGIVFDSSQTVVNTQHSTYENRLIFLTSPVPSGLYTCTVTNDLGNATSDYGINIGDPEPAKIIHSPDSYSTAVVNNTFTTSCHGYGIELPAIIWNKHGVQLTNNAHVAINQRYVSNSTYQFVISTLTISATELEDTGNYSCIARNSNGTDVHWLILKIVIPAQFSSIPINVHVAVDLCSNITLTCESYGLPAPTITWKHDNTQINIIMFSIATVTVYHNASNGITYISSNLSISSVRYQDRGLYMCTIQNEFGNDTTTSTLSINYEAAEIMNLTADQMIVNESDSIRISCEARGSPPLTITWQRAIHPNNLVRISENMHRSIILNSTDEMCNVTVQKSILEIHSAKVEDGVEYICQAQNDHPYVVASEQLEINIQILDECASAPCQNGGECTDEYLDLSCNCVGTNHTGDRCQKPLPIAVDPGAPPSPNISNITTTSTTQTQLVSPVNLICEATGAPPLTYRWYRDGQLIVGKIRPYLYIAEFSPEDRGNYSCEVINDEGQDESSGTLLTIKGVRQYRIGIATQNMQSTKQITSEVNARLLRNNSLNITGEVYGLITVNETTSNSTTVIVTLYTSESYSSDYIQKALAQVLHSAAYSQIVVFDIKRYDGCSKENDTVSYWPETEISQSISLPCPCQNLIQNPTSQNRAFNITRRCMGSYSMGGYWEEVDYQTQCGLPDIAFELCKANISAENDPERLSQSLVEITNRSEEIQAVGISIATTLIEALTDDATENEEIRENYLTIIDNLIQADEEEVARSQAVGEAPMRLLSSLGDFIDRVNLSNTSTILTRETYAILIEDVNTDSFIGEILTVDLGSVEDAFRQGNKIEESALNKEGTNSSFNERFTATVRVPQSILRDDNGQKQRLSYSVFVQGNLFLNQSSSQQSIIVGIRMNGTKRVRMLQSPIAVYLQRQQPTNNSSGNLTCGRWNTTIHGWSTHDCQISNFSEIDGKQRSRRIMRSAGNGTALKGLESTVYETKFYQPGYFGLILDLTYGIVDPLPHRFTFTLEVISYICLVLSLVCLAFLIITYLATKQLRNNCHGQILINMSISLACLYLTFLIGARTAPVPALCGISAALLQYFMLVFFGWTAVEAVYLYRNLVQVLVSQITGFVVKAGLTVWILPILVVVLSAGPGYKDYYINDSSFCRSTGLPFWLGVILPFLILNIFNWCVFIMIMVSLIRRSMNFKEKIDLKDKLESVKKQVAIAVGLATLFGLGWGFGLAASSTATKGVTFTFQLLFSLFVGLQGVILFVLHGVRKREARGQWKEWFTKVSSKSMQLYSIAKSASTATDSRIEMSTLQRSEKKDWGSVPTLDINEIENKSMITESEKSEKEDLGASKKSTASVKESVKEDGAAHRFTKFDNEN